MSSIYAATISAALGFDLLYETSRYVNALTQTTLPLQSNPAVSVTNPLYDTTATSAPRDRRWCS